jgi:hypothetical protein
MVASLIGTVADINNFVNSDFSNCSGSLTPFEQKICQVAQAASAEQQAVLQSQLATFSKMLQDSLYGSDCTSTVSPGCPAPGSILSDVASHASQIATLTSDIAALDSRLTTAESAITALDTRLDAVEATSATTSYRTVQVCGNIVNSGPVYEIALIRSDNAQVVGWVQSGSKDGLGIWSQAGGGTKYLTTSLNTVSCKFKVYDLTTTVKVCWKNTDKNASSAAIDAACLPTPTGTCTCAN